MNNSIIAVRHVVALSSGASSAVAAQRVLDRYGRDSVDLVFADTQIEDADNYRFLLDLTRHYDHWLHILHEGRTPLRVGEDEHIIPNQKIHPCTKALKIRPLQDFVRWRRAQGHHVVMHIGMNIQDAKPRRDKPYGRLTAPLCNWAALGVRVEYPLLWEPVCLDSKAEIRSWGIDLPRMYRLGYSHANCGGVCVAQGMRDWKRTLTNFPQRYAAIEAWEQYMRRDPRFADYGFLRDQSGGTVTAKTLRQFREEYEQARGQGQLTLFDLEVDLDDPTCGVECGIGSE